MATEVRAQASIRSGPVKDYLGYRANRWQPIWFWCCPCGGVNRGTQGQVTGFEPLACAGCGWSATEQLRSPLEAAAEVEAIGRRNMTR